MDPNGGGVDPRLFQRPSGISDQNQPRSGEDPRVRPPGPPPIPITDPYQRLPDHLESPANITIDAWSLSIQTNRRNQRTYLKRILQETLHVRVNLARPAPFHLVAPNLQFLPHMLPYNEYCIRQMEYERRRQIAENILINRANNAEAQDLLRTSVHHQPNPDAALSERQEFGPGMHAALFPKQQSRLVLHPPQNYADYSNQEAIQVRSEQPGPCASGTIPQEPPELLEPQKRQSRTPRCGLAKRSSGVRGLPNRLRQYMQAAHPPSNDRDQSCQQGQRIQRQDTGPSMYSHRQQGNRRSPLETAPMWNFAADEAPGGRLALNLTPQAKRNPTSAQGAANLGREGLAAILRRDAAEITADMNIHNQSHNYGPEGMAADLQRIAADGSADINIQYRPSIFGPEGMDMAVRPNVAGGTADINIQYQGPSIFGTEGMAMGFRPDVAGETVDINTLNRPINVGQEELPMDLRRAFAERSADYALHNRPSIFGTEGMDFRPNAAGGTADNNIQYRPSIFGTEGMAMDFRPDIAGETADINTQSPPYFEG